MAERTTQSWTTVPHFFVTREIEASALNQYREKLAPEVERTHTTGEDFRLEYRLIAADGRVVWVLDETVTVRDKEYRPIVLQGFLLDITERVERGSQPAALRAAG